MRGVDARESEMKIYMKLPEIDWKQGWKGWKLLRSFQSYHHLSEALCVFAEISWNIKNTNQTKTKVTHQTDIP